MQPIIGITTNLSEDESSMQLKRTYTDVLLQAGALPILLPATDDMQAISAYADMVDGLLLAGGCDVDPLLFGEQQRWESGAISILRDTFEIGLLKAVLALGSKPVFGVCRGMQVINIALGGSLYQDLQSDLPGRTIAHRQHQRAIYPCHSIAIDVNTHLHSILGTDTLMVNSLHHQAVKHLGNGLVISACAPDGIAEALELTEHPFCIGVQWHPEVLCSQTTGITHRQLFKAFVNACRALH